MADHVQPVAVLLARGWSVLSAAVGEELVLLPVRAEVIQTWLSGMVVPPVVFPVLAGASSHWVTTGGSNPYPSPNAGTEATQFAIYVNNPGGITPARARNSQRRRSR